MFTLEHCDDNDAALGYRIHAHGRYSHTDSYVRRTLTDAGFEDVAVDMAHLRREHSAYVQGLVVVARRRTC